MLTARPSRASDQIQDFDAVPMRSLEGVQHENTGNSSGIGNENRPFTPLIPAFSGVRAITKSVVITIELFELTHRWAERSMGVMQTLFRCRTPHEIFTTQGNFFLEHVNDTFEGMNKLLRQAAVNSTSRLNG